MHACLDRCWCAGPDRAKVTFQRQPDGTRVAALNVDEIKNFVDGRYVSASEAYWRIAQFKLQQKSHVVVTLPVHLPDQQSVMFMEDEEGERYYYA